MVTLRKKPTQRRSITSAPLLTPDANLKTYSKLTYVTACLQSVVLKSICFALKEKSYHQFLKVLTQH